MLEGIPIEQYGMAGMVLIVCLAVIWKGADLLKSVLTKPVTEQRTPAPPIDRSAGNKTLVIENIKEKVTREQETLAEKLVKLEADSKDRDKVASDEINRLREENAKQSDDLAAIKERLGRLEGRSGH